MNAEFCDTNIFVYAYDPSMGEKHEKASLLLARLWEDRAGVTSVQILQELFVTLTRKGVILMPIPQARNVIDALSTWPVFCPEADHVLDAIDGSVRWGVSFWDAMMLTAANELKAEVCWSEDLNH
ncbi:MAG: PIN domain-containing protein, partial [Chloroflexota bacterium]